MPSISGRIHKSLALHFAQKCLQLPSRPVVSFTFDDFPRSALHVGGEILRTEGLRGTYYTSFGLMGTTTSVGPLFTAPDLEKLLRDGHELACHSCYHRSCRQSSTNQFRADCARNRGTAAGLFNGLRLRNFSYPYGDVRFPAKSALALDYDSCRSIEPGINDSHADLAFLRATPIYSATPPGTIRRLIAQNREQGGWLIFYTHDVAPAPSPFGCTPEEFRSVLSLAIESRAEILNVAQVLQRIPRLQLSGSESQTSITQ